MIVITLGATWAPISLIRSGRTSQIGANGDDVPQDPPSGEQHRPGPYSTFNGPRLVGPDDPVEVMIELEDPPAIEAFTRAQVDAGAFGRTAGPRAVAAARASIVRIEREQQNLTATLTGPRFAAKITVRVQRVFNGMAVHVASGKLIELQQLPGVKAVHIPGRFYPATDTSVPFIQAPQAWQGSAVVQGVRGEGIIIAIVDTGIDYTHANLGGSGNPAVYTANNPNVIGDVIDFPNLKVIGGRDLVGNNYNAEDPNNNIPNPDPDPIDCRTNGHGTAAAGVAAGSGVNSNGTAYTGPYDLSTPFTSLRIGPGVAPKAGLFSIKVYGCDQLGATSSTVVTQAIDLAMDPNQDGNFSDRAEVVILPGGGPFDTLPDDPVLTSINNGAQAGVSYVGPAGNGGDTTLSVGGPSIAKGALSAVAIADNGVFNQALRVETPGAIAGRYRMAVAGFGRPLENTIAGTLAPSSPANGCTAFTNPAQINGNIAFIDRGTCNFTVKARLAQQAGARAVVIANTVETLPDVMGDDGSGSDITVTSFLLEKNSADRIRQELTAGFPVTGRIERGDVFSRSGLADTYAPFNPLGGVYRHNVSKPDIAAPGQNISATVVGSGSSYGQFSGTSMSAPHVAGGVALVIQRYKSVGTPFTTADIYRNLRDTGAKIFTGENSVLPERHPLRLNVQAAVGTDAKIVPTGTFASANIYGDARAFLASESGELQLTLAWLRAATASFTATYTPLADVRGFNVSIPNPNGTVQANSSVTFPVEWTVDPAALKRDCAPWINPMQASNSRHCLPEELGYVNIIFPDHPPVRTLIDFVVRPASNMSTTQSLIDLANPTGTLVLNLTGRGVNNGPTQPADPISLVSPFELQGLDGNDDFTPKEIDFLDFQNAGVRSNYKTTGSIGAATTRLTFGISTWGDWESLNYFNFNILIDTNRDGTDDFNLFSTSFANSQGAPSDVFITRLQNLSSSAITTQLFVNLVPASFEDTLPFYTNIAVLGVIPSALGLTDANGKFNWQVKISRNGVVVDQSESFTYDLTKPGVEFGGITIFDDLPGMTMPVGYNRDDFRAADSIGAMLLHHYNTEGHRVQLLPERSSHAVVGVSAASFRAGEIARESIVAGFATNLATGTAVGGTIPLPLALLNSSMRIVDDLQTVRLSPLFFVSPTQVNFQLAPGTLNGPAMMTATTGEGEVSIGNLTVTSVAPGLFAANANGQGVPAAVVLRVRPNGSQVSEPVARFDSMLGRFVPLPLDLGPAGDQVFLLLFGTGIRFRSALSAVSCSVGGMNMETPFAGAQGGFVGLDQINARLDRSLIGKGEVNVILTADGKTSNTLLINIK